MCSSNAFKFRCRWFGKCSQKAPMREGLATNYAAPLPTRVHQKGRGARELRLRDRIPAPAAGPGAHLPAKHISSWRLRSLSHRTLDPYLLQG